MEIFMTREELADLGIRLNELNGKIKREKRYIKESKIKLFNKRFLQILKVGGTFSIVPTVGIVGALIGGWNPFKLNTM